MKKITLSFFASFTFYFFNAQSWVELLQDTGSDFYSIQRSAQNYFNTIDIAKPGTGYKQFKRWEYFTEPRVYPSGDLNQLKLTWPNFQKFLRDNQSGQKSASAAAVGTWTLMGPIGPPGGLVFGIPTRTGRDNFITFHPNNSGTYWCGAASGGLWKTTNNGASWTTNTDYLDVIGCSDLAIDPGNPNIMYLATGDGEAQANFRASIGVLKSTDGGLTWNNTGFTYTQSQQRQIRRLLLNPQNTSVLIVVTNAGTYRSADAGATWSLSSTGNCFDAEFKPGDPNTVYLGASNSFRLSTDGGITFATITSGIPGSGSNRLAIAVTPADSNYVYVVRSNSSDGGFGGIYRSTNSGQNFNLMSTAPNVLGASCNGNSSGGFGWYGIGLAASPLDKNEVVVGGINIFRSTNGGSSWQIYGCQSGTSTNPPFIHADHHELEYTPSGDLYSANDGGIAQRTGSTWTDLTNPRNISEIYRIGLSALSPNLWITGHQDNGTSLYSNGSYMYTSGSDGLDCFIDRTNNNRMFCSAQNGGFKISNNGGTSWSGFTTGMTGSAPWLSPWKQDPVNPNLLYAGYSQLFYSTGGAWSQLTPTGGGGSIVEFAIAPSNNQVIYVIHGTSVRKTNDGGQTWTNITSGIPGGSAAPNFITIDPNDENNAWITCSGYSATNKVFRTTNGGLTWTNITGNLPNLPANCSVYQPGTNDRIYVGMDIGVYTRDNSTNVWTLLNTGLPNVPISDMEISPAAPTILRAATYGRGVYETELIQPLTVPTSSFVSSGIYCAGNSIQFTDLSSEAPNTWNWTVNPSSGVTVSSFTSQNPTMTFSNSGVYTVSLISSNGFGAGAAEVQTISINALPSLTLSSSGISSTVCVDEEVILTAAGANSYTWTPGNIISSSISFTAALTNSGTYSVTAKSTEGCFNNESIAVIVSECTGLNSTFDKHQEFKVYPNPTNHFLTIQHKSEFDNSCHIKLMDISGKELFLVTHLFNKKNGEFVIDLSQYSKGIYFIELTNEQGKSQKFKICKE